MPRVEFPYTYVPDSKIGSPIALAEMFVGVPSTDPEIEANQYQLSAIQEDGTEVTIAQPVRLGAGGVPLYNGSPVEVVLTEDIYSIRILNKLGQQSYYHPSYSPFGGQVPSLDKYIQIKDVTSENYVLVLDDDAKYLRIKTDNPTTVTVPSNTAVEFLIGTQITFAWIGAGSIEFLKDVGVVINTPDLLKLRKQFSVLTLIKVGVDEWDMMGDLELP